MVSLRKLDMFETWQDVKMERLRRWKLFEDTNAVRVLPRTSKNVQKETPANGKTVKMGNLRKWKTCENGKPAKMGNL